MCRQIAYTHVFGMLQYWVTREFTFQVETASSVCYIHLQVPI